MELSTGVQVITYTQHTRRTHNMSNLCIARPTQFIFAKLSSAAAMAEVEVAREKSGGRVTRGTTKNR